LANIYVIAGPPGIGKSTSGGSVIPLGISILDPDLIAHLYKKQGYADYKDIGNLKFNELLKKELFSENDFAIELNLGFQSHYDFVRSVKSFNSKNTINVVLFYTDDLELCLKRAEIRHQSGLHLVDPDTIREMYQSTVPLLIENFSLVTTLYALNVTAHELPKICIEFSKSANELILADEQPNWISRELKSFLKMQLHH